MPTPPKELPDHEVLAFYDRIVAVLRAEGYDKFLPLGGEQFPLERGEPGTLVGVLVSILKCARSARARVLRNRRKAEHEATGTTHYQVFNDAPVNGHANPRKFGEVHR